MPILHPALRNFISGFKDDLFSVSIKLCLNKLSDAALVPLSDKWSDSDE